MEKEEICSNWGLPLPSHIAPVIFSKVPISNLPACRIVCKSWNSLVLDLDSDYSFKTQLPKAILFSTRGPFPHSLTPKIHCFDIGTLSFVASCTFPEPGIKIIDFLNHCNGLLFLDKSVDFGRDGYCEGIFNPMTHEFFQTPTVCESYLTANRGFGFSPNTKQYKLFRVHSRSEPVSELKVLRFGTDDNQWTSVFMPSPVAVESHGVYMDGAVYWVGKEKVNEYLVYALNVETENFEVATVLEIGPHSYEVVEVVLQPFDGTIFAIVFVFEPFQIQLWRMPKEKKNSSWIRDFIVPGKFSSPSIDLVKAEHGKIFLRVKNDLFSFDGKSLSLIKTLMARDRHFITNCFIEFLHFGSLPSILAGDDS